MARQWWLKQIALAVAGTVLAGFLLLGLAEGGTEWEKCETFMSLRLAATVCSYPGVELKLNATKMNTILTMTADALKVEGFKQVWIIVPHEATISKDCCFGFYEPVTRTIWLTKMGRESGDRIYYTISHEIAHYFMDIRGVPIRDHHCWIYNSPGMKQIEETVERWLGTDEKVVDVFARINSCHRGDNEGHK